MRDNAGNAREALLASRNFFPKTPDMTDTRRGALVRGAIAAAMLAAIPVSAMAQQGKGKCQTLQARCALQVHGEAAGDASRHPKQFGCNPATGRWTVAANAASLRAWQKCLSAGLRKPPARR